MSFTPEILSVAGMSIRRAEAYDQDARGILWTWEQPQRNESYIVSCDPTVGIPGWARALRSQDDYRTDNAAIEVLRVGREGRRDVQVAEWAAPVSPYDLTPYLNAIGRLYAGDSESGEALLINEVYPGPGLAVYQELVHRFSYSNFWMWKQLDSATPKPTQYPGWYANSPRNQRDLWIKGHYFIMHGGVAINSPWLIEEMTDCEIDPVKMRGKAAYGRHDDRVYALLMALWAAHDWTTMVIPEFQQEQEKKVLPDWQRTDISSDKMYDEWENKVSEWLQ